MLARFRVDAAVFVGESVLESPHLSHNLHAQLPVCVSLCYQHSLSKHRAWPHYSLHLPASMCINRQRSPH